MLYDTVLYCAMLYCAKLYWTVLYCTIGYCTRLLYYTPRILYYTILYYQSQHDSALSLHERHSVSGQSAGGSMAGIPGALLTCFGVSGFLVLRALWV